MKEGIHPNYRSVVFHDLSSDFKVLTRSTASSSETIKWEDGNEYPVIKFDLSSASHAFYTGKDQQLNDKGGRIEQFRLRYGKKVEAATEAAAQAPAAAAETTGS
ncbi:MAG: type B 50S ribosomal protein L31 [bacterium]|nr:type B 50S ribosomal protein L31 [bacterium]